MIRHCSSGELGSIIITLMVVSLLSPVILVNRVQAADQTKIVYVAICIDTEMSGGLDHDAYLGTTNPNPTMYTNCYQVNPPQQVAAVMGNSFRDTHRDPSGNPFRMTWFAEMDYLFAQSNYVWGNGSPAGVSGYTAIYDMLMDNWGIQIQTYGDTIEYHHHFMIYNGAWQQYYYDNQYPEYQMYALDHMIIDRNFYPSIWRTGWLSMPDALSQWLEKWMPFDYTPSSGIWYPTHPSELTRWQTTCPGGEVSQSDVNNAFAYAEQYGTAIYSYYCHSRDDMASYIDAAHSYLTIADNDEIDYPGVTFKYVSAREAMQLALGFTDFTAPTLTVTNSGGTYTITSSEALWGNHPYVALKYADGTYGHMEATPAGTNMWTAAPTQLVNQENVAVRARLTSGLPIAAATASSYLPGHEPSKAIDGDETTNSFWDSTPGTVPQWLELDLGSVQTFANIRTHFWDGDARAYRYYIEVSNDDEAYAQVVAEKDGQGGMWDYFSPAISARYIKITVTYNSANEYAHIIEVNVGAQAASITASSYDGIYTPDKAIDGVESTSNYWGTASANGLPQWLQLDLRSSVSISKITTHFYDGDTRTYTYYIEASNDGSSWITIVPLKTGSSSVTDTFSETTARYVRITVTDCTTPWKATHIEEIKIYHVATTSLPPLDAIGVAASDLYGNPGTVRAFTQSPYALTVGTLGSGSVTKSPNQATYANGTVVTLTAVPSAGWSFGSWSGDLSGSANPASLTVTGDMAVAATFIQNQYALTVNVVGADCSVTKSPDQATYVYGTSVQLTPVAAVGWSFSSWSGDVYGSMNPVTVTVNSETSVAATFIQNGHSLTVSTVGSGSVVRVPNQASYHLDDTVQLTAVPSAGWSFGSWSGDLSGSANPASLTVTGDMAVAATFIQNQYGVFGETTPGPNSDAHPVGYAIACRFQAPADGTITRISAYIRGRYGSGLAKAMIYSDVSGEVGTLLFESSEITLSSSWAWHDFSASYPIQSGSNYWFAVFASVEFQSTWDTGQANQAAETGGWVYPIVPTHFSAQFHYDETVGIYATYEVPAYSLTVSTVGSGCVVRVPNQASYHLGDVVQLTATPVAGWSFSGWSGALTGSTNPASLAITGNMSVTATFTQNVYNLTVNTIGNGNVNLNNTGPYHYGDTVQFTAVPATGWGFSVWTGDLSGSANPTTLVINGNKAVSATFTESTYALTVTTSGSGSVVLNNSGPYHYGDIVQFTANPTAGWSFDHWSGDLSGSVNPATILIDDNKTVTATFTQNTYTVSVTVLPSSVAGTVTPNATGPYHYDDLVVLTESPSLGYTFSGWSGDGSGTGSVRSVTVTGNMTVTATYTQNVYGLTVSTVGNGSVNINNTGPYHYNDVVQLNAVAANGWSFQSWSGDLSGSTNPTIILINGNKTVTATFTQNAYSLTVSTVGSGSVARSPDQASYYYGDVVELTATPVTGWSFSAWGGALSGSANPASLTITGNKVVTATFTQNTYTLTINSVGNGNVNLNNSGPYHYGDAVQFTAVPATGWSFAGWTGDLSGSANPATLVINRNGVVNATFTQNTYTLTLTTSGSGSVVLNNSGPYQYGDKVQLTANAIVGWSFDHWSGDLTGSANSGTLTITGNMSATAIFSQNTYTLTTSVDGSGSVNLNNLGPYHYGDVVQFTAVPATGWSFEHWSQDLTGSSNPATLAITGNMAVTAAFTQDQYTLPLTIVGGGSVVKSPDQATYTWNSSVTLTASANVGWTFANWTGDASGTANAITVNMTGSKTVTATFTWNTYTLTVTTVGSGDVNLNNTGPYYYGEVVQLTAVPASGWSFDHWRGDLGGSMNPAILTIDGSKAVTAAFTQNVYNLTVTTIGSGSVNLNNIGPYHYGDVVELTAVPAAGWSFQSWSGDLLGSSNPATISINGNKAVTVTFIQNAYSLTINIVGSGSVVKVPDQASYHYGDVVQLTAVPDSGWSFSAWGGDLSGSANPASLTVTKDMAITATFTQNTYTLTVNVFGTGCSVTRDNNGPYHYDDVVHLTANAAVGWAFSQWSGALTGNANPAALTINGDMSVTAAFIQNEYSLTVTVTPSSAAGSVSANIPGPYHWGEVVTLTPTANLGYTFSGWTGDGVNGAGNTRVVTISGGMAVTAAFTQNEYTLTISYAGDGSGSVSTDKSAPYDYGDVVQLTATPATGSTFSGWSDDLGGSTNPTTITIDGNKAVTAAFTRIVYTLTIGTSGSGSVSTDKSAPYYYGDVVQLTASSSAGWSFSVWSGDVSGSVNPVSLTIDGNKAVTATFIQNAYTLTASTLGSGSVTKSPDQATYHYGEVVQLTATPAAGWSFSSWSGALTGSNSPASLTITGDMVVTATFIQNGYTLTVNTVGSGSVVKVPDQALYHLGDVVQLTATPTVGWSFSGWSGALSGSANPASLTVIGDVSVTAAFTQNTYTLTISTVGSGSVKTDKSPPYHYGDVVQLTVAPTVGWSFSGWSGDLGGSSNPTTITVDGNKAVTATFTQNVYTLTISLAGDGSGSVLTDKSAPYHYGDIVQLTATPAAGSGFSGWSGDLTGSTNPQSITIDGSKAVTAAFTRIVYTLTISTSGSGTVSTDKSAPYYYGDVVQLTAVPAVGWSFSGWSGALSGSADPANLTITGNMSVTATFTQNVYTLTVTTVGSGSVNLNSTGPYHYGDVVELTAAPAAGWSFSSWSGDLGGSTSPTTITIDGNMSVTGTFNRIVYTLTISKSGSGSVSTDKSAPYYYGDVVQLTAIPAAGWSFQSWSGDLLGSANPSTIVIDGNKAVTATFTQSGYTLTVVASPVEGGSVSKSPDKSIYHYNDVVQLSATPSTGWSFSGWSGGLTGNPTFVTITGNMEVTAYFTQNEYTLTVSASPAEGGSVSKSPDQPTYSSGTVVTLTAVPAAGWSFSAWSGALTGSTNPASLTVTGDVSVTATFTQNTYTLTVGTVGSGSVNLNNAGPYHYGDVVQLIASPAAGWSFSVWSGDLSGSANPTSILMDGNKAVTATFTQNTYALTVTIVGSGSVSKSPDQASYHYGDVVTLTASPTAYWSFSAWSGDASGSVNPVTVTIDGNKAVTATFIQNSYTLTVTAVGSGSVTKSPDQASYHYGDVVQLTAVPAAGWSFSGWSGALTGSANPAPLTITGNMSVTATFTQNSYDVVFTETGLPSGTQWSAILNGATQSSTTSTITFNILSGTYSWSVTNPIIGASKTRYFTATPSGTTGVTQQTSISMTYVTQYQVSFAVSPNKAGTTSPSGTNVWITAGPLQISATANSGYVFSQWSTSTTSITIDNVNSATAIATINGPGTITANFVTATYTVTFQESNLPLGTLWNVTFNGVTQTSTTNTITFTIAAGTYSWSVANQISGGTGTRYVTSTPSGRRTVSGPTTIQIQYQTQYYLTVQATPAGYGSTSPSSGWYYAGTTVTISATASKGHTFKSWTGTGTGSYTGTSARSSVIMNSPITEIATFT